MKQRKEVNTQDMVVMYTERHLTLRQIAVVFGISHSCVARRLRRALVSSRDGEWVVTECSYCGNTIRKTRSVWRKTSSLYCGEQCYFKARENPAYRPWRQGQNIARQIVSRFTDVQPHNVVHHEDGDDHNNEPHNLRVFACQADHMRYHHGITPVAPIWDGSAAVVR